MRGDRQVVGERHATVTRVPEARLRIPYLLHSIPSDHWLASKLLWRHEAGVVCSANGSTDQQFRVGYISDVNKRLFYNTQLQASYTWEALQELHHATVVEQHGLGRN